MIGFDHIIMYQNDSTDGTDGILKELNRIGAVKYFYNRAKRGAHQIRAYKRAARQPEYLESDWAMALDIDEFLLVKAGAGKVQDLIAECPDSDCIYVQWKTFGNAGLIELENDLVIHRFRRSEAPKHGPNAFGTFKSLFRQSAFDHPGIHKPAQSGGSDGRRIKNGSGLDTAGFALKKCQCTDPGGMKLAQINHYIVRDVESFLLKNARGSAHQADRDLGRDYWRKRNRNHVVNDGMDVHVEATRREVDNLNRMSGGTLKRLTAEAYERHKDRVRDLMGGPARELYDYCVGDARTQQG
ncbi:glycosyltransferase family 2 protein [Falsirhodobacter algicola]|uniref:Glycosyltransferase family 92 protein n=1 Tax=Falsirhodobacter algicola TaxID=2692330 RepID=A0A8J8MTC3_9RHOB|nr:glycosyltransferase family 2 protein [Falsirhodobacter algicola]QUS36332.1 glycosyltransferase family 92 protein [Falsirhodobacter algicola]